MLTRKKMRYEIARLKANAAYFGLERDLLEADNNALMSEVKSLRDKAHKMEAEQKALLDTVSMLCSKNKALVSENRACKLKIMSYEAMWEAQKRRSEHAKSA